MWYWAFRFLFTIILRLFFKFKVEGKENIPKKTNFIVVSNHASFLDPIVLGLAIPQKVYWIAFQKLYSKFWLRWFIQKMESIPTGGSSKKAIYLLTQGKNIGLFPEGTRTNDGNLKKFRRGAALLAIRTGRPILPCALLGTYRVLPWWRKFPKLFLPIKVKIGKPIYLLKEFDEIVDDLLLQEGTLRIRRVIEKMLNDG